MIAAIELGKEYAQVCVKTASMKDAESVTTVAGSEAYRIPTNCDMEDEMQLQELFRRLWKLISPYGSREALDYLVFCLEDNTDHFREKLLNVVQIYNIPVEKVRFLDKAECFCAYVFHQSAELLTHNALLIENHNGEKEKFLLHKQTRMKPAVAEVRNISEKSLEDVFTDHAISSVFLVGDDYEEVWMQQNLKLLKTGRRVFAGKNLYVKGACYRGTELLQKSEMYLYLGAEKVGFHIALKAEESHTEKLVVIAEGGRNWYESDAAVDVFLPEDETLEVALIPINGREKKTTLIHLEGLPKRPKKTTRLHVEITFADALCAKIRIQDLGFGELFPHSDLIYEGELRWEQ